MTQRDQGLCERVVVGFYLVVTHIPPCGCRVGEHLDQWGLQSHVLPFFFIFPKEGLEVSGACRIHSSDYKKDSFWFGDL